MQIKICFFTNVFNLKAKYALFEIIQDLHLFAIILIFSLLDVIEVSYL